MEACEQFLLFPLGKLRVPRNLMLVPFDAFLVEPMSIGSIGVFQTSESDEPIVSFSRSKEFRILV